jgi:cytidine deaminase
MWGSPSGLQPGFRPAHGAYISAEHLKQRRQAEGKTADEFMLDLLPEAQKLAYAPISNYQVGAVVRGKSGALYLGGNLEIPGQPLAFTVHAEQAASSYAYMHGEDGIAAIAVTSAPCGHCRQFLEELSPGGEIDLIVKGRGPVRLESLLPAAFGPSDLGLQQGALPIHRVKIAPLGVREDALLDAAFAAASASYAPYTKAYSGVAIKLSDGSTHTGSYIENAAFNPSLSPLQVALVAVRNADRTFEEITDVVLTELEEAVISQESVAETVLATLCPKVRLRTALGSIVA